MEFRLKKSGYIWRWVLRSPQSRLISSYGGCWGMCGRKRSIRLVGTGSDWGWFGWYWLRSRLAGAFCAEPSQLEGVVNVLKAELLGFFF